ncbi:MAG: winged helix-turn-helix domain-containing protein [Candidatus Micrarchaeota archaeon]
MRILLNRKANFAIIAVLAVALGALGFLYLTIAAPSVASEKMLAADASGRTGAQAEAPTPEPTTAPAASPEQTATPESEVEYDGPPLPPEGPDVPQILETGLPNASGGAFGAGAAMRTGDNATPTPGAEATDTAWKQVASVGAEDAPLLAPNQNTGAGANAPSYGAAAAGAEEGRGLLSNPFFYYLAGAVVAIALLLNLFKVSFAPEMAYDSAIFKTLSSETRMELLASLQQRRKTLSELAAEREISLPGAKQHLELLEEAGLIRKIDEGRKWKYYELTPQGKTILAERYS